MLREKLFTIGEKVVRHGRYITLQMAEVAILQALFVEILRLIDRLRPGSFAAMTAADPGASRLLDRTGVCGARRGTLSQRENVTGRAFDRQIGSTKRGDHHGECRIRTGFASHHHFCYATSARD